MSTATDQSFASLELGLVTNNAGGQFDRAGMNRNASAVQREDDQQLTDLKAESERIRQHYKPKP